MYRGSMPRAPGGLPTNVFASPPGAVAQGPGCPTFVERAIAAVPLPYVVTSLLLAAAAQGPGLFLANLVDAGDLNAAIQATFPGLVTEPASLVFLSMAIGVGFYTVLLWMIRFTRRQLLSAEQEISPLLVDGAAGFRRIYDLLHNPWPVGGLAILFAGFFWVIGNHAEVLTPAHVVFVAVQMLVISLATSTVLWTYFVTLWGLRRIGKEPLRLRPYTEDPMLGLRPLGTMSVSATMVYFAMIAVVLVTALAYPQSPLYLAFLLVLLGFGAVLFVLPLLGIHRLMVEEKRKVERALAVQAAQEWSAMESAPSGGEADLGELRRLILSLRGFVAHERAERKAASLPTWPFDPQVTGRIAAIVLTGVIAVLGRAAVDWLLVRP